MVRKRRTVRDDTAIPEALRPGSVLHLQAPGAWAARRLAWGREQGREGLLTAGTTPLEWIRETRAGRRGEAAQDG